MERCRIMALPCADWRLRVSEKVLSKESGDASLVKHLNLTHVILGCLTTDVLPSGPPVKGDGWCWPC